RSSNPFGLDTLYTLHLTRGSSSLEQGIKRIVKDWEPWTSNLILICEGNPLLIEGLSTGKRFGLAQVVKRAERIFLYASSMNIIEGPGKPNTHATAIPPPASPKGSEIQKGGSDVVVSKETRNSAGVVPQSEPPKTQRSE